MGPEIFADRTFGLFEAKLFHRWLSFLLEFHQENKTFELLLGLYQKIFQAEG